jgi:uncharacterized alpha-E superfamily protein
MFVRHQVRAQLSHDLWCVVLAVFITMCIDAGNLEKTRRFQRFQCHL